VPYDTHTIHLSLNSQLHQKTQATKTDEYNGDLFSSCLTVRTSIHLETVKLDAIGRETPVLSGIGLFQFVRQCHKILLIYPTTITRHEKICI